MKTLRAYDISKKTEFDVQCICHRGNWAIVNMVDDNRNPVEDEYVLMHVPTGTPIGSDNGNVVIIRGESDTAILVLRALEPWSDFGSDKVFGDKVYLSVEMKSVVNEIYKRRTS